MSSGNSPKVSIIVPNYNHAQYLTKRLDSVFAQTYQNFEIVILDDASTDHSVEIIQPYLKREGVRFHPNEVNSGTPFAQWERGVNMARGEYIWIAESDDVAEPELLDTLIHLLEENPNVGVAYCQSKRIGPLGEDLGDFHFWTDDLDSNRWKTDYINSGIDECARFLYWKNTIPNASAVVFRKNAYADIGHSPLSYRLCGDWLVWVKMLSKFDIAYSPLFLNHFRIHDKSVRETTREELRNQEIRRIQLFIARDIQLPNDAKKRIAIDKLSEFLSRVRAAPAKNHLSVACQIFTRYLPFFLISPITVINGFINRHK